MRRRTMNRRELALYSELQAVAATDSPQIVTVGRGDRKLRAGRSLERKHLAVVEGNIVRPTPAAIWFRRAIAAQREAVAA